jgi:hypothetical protein
MDSALLYWLPIELLSAVAWQPRIEILALSELILQIWFPLLKFPVGGDGLSLGTIHYGSFKFDGSENVVHVLDILK